MSGKSGPLSSIVALEASQRPAALFAGMLLADFGAEVIQLEPANTKPHTSRTAVLNRGKVSWQLPDDATFEEYYETLKLVVERANIVLLDSLTLWPETFQNALRSLTEGTNAICIDYTVFDHGEQFGEMGGKSIEAMTGMMHLSGTFDREGPVYLSIPTVDYVAGSLGALMAAAGLVSGVSFNATTSEFAASLNAQINKAVWQDEIVERVRDDPLQQVTPLVRYYEASDGWLVFCAPTMGLFAKVCKAIDRIDLLVDPHAAGAPWDFQGEDKTFMIETLSAIFKEKPVDHWMKRFEEEGVIGAPVWDRKRFIMEHPQVEAEGLRVEVEDPELGTTWQMGVAARLHNTPGNVAHGAPRLGQGGAEIASRITESREPVTSRRMAMGELPLAGVRVLDIANFIAGPLTCRNLTTLGAEVIKIEPTVGDAFRPLGFSFATVNRGRRSICIDLNKPEAAEVFEKLVATSDVVVSNLIPKLAEAQGVTRENLTRIKPDIIFCQITGWGSLGPMAHWPGMDPQFQAVSGYSLTQGGGSMPRISSATPVDIMAGCLASFATACALARKSLFPKKWNGEFIEVSLLQGCAGSQYGELIEYEARKDQMLPRDAVGTRALDRIYRCGDDEWLYLFIDEETGWKRLLASIGSELKATEADAMNASFDSPLATQLEQLFATRETSYWQHRLTGPAITCVPVLSTVDVARRYISYFDFVKQEPFGQLIQAAWPARINDQRPLTGPAPGLGEHTIELLTELGYDMDQITEFLTGSVAFVG